MKKSFQMLTSKWHSLLDLVWENWVDNTRSLWLMVAEISPITPYFLIFRKIAPAFFPVITGFMMGPIMKAIEKGDFGLLKPYLPYGVIIGIGWTIMMFFSVQVELFIEKKKLEFDRKGYFKGFELSYWFPAIWSIDKKMKTKINLFKRYRREIVRSLENQFGLISATITAGAGLYSVLSFDPVIIVFMIVLATVSAWNHYKSLQKNLNDEQSPEESFWRDRWWNIERMLDFPRNSQIIFTDSFPGLFDIGKSTAIEAVRRELQRKEREVRNERVSEVIQIIMEIVIIGYVVYRSYLGDAKDAVPAYLMGKMFYRGVLSFFRSIVQQSKVKSEVSVIEEITNLAYEQMIADSQKREIVITSSSKITLNDFSFRFPGSESLHFDCQNFEFKLGKSYAVIGVNGEGKTTLTNFLFGRYFPTGGKVLIDGVPTTEIKKSTFPKLFTIYSPKFEIIECLTVGEFIDPNSELTDEQCLKVLSDVHLDKKLSKYGLETVIGAGYEKGTGFSSGEEQKLLIARLLAQLLVSKRFVIGDEMTANIAEYEQEYFINLIKEYSYGCIFITHTKKVVNSCDQIIAIVDMHIYDSDGFKRLRGRTKDKLVRLIETGEED